MRLVERRRLAAVAVGVVAATALLSGCTAKASTADATKNAAAPVTVTINETTPASAANYHGWLAADLGFFKKEGINPVFQDIAGNQVAPLVTGQSDIAVVGLNGISALAQNQDVKFIDAYPGHSSFAIIVPKDSPLAKDKDNYKQLFNDLVGTTLASSVPGQYVDNVARYLVENSGHTLKQIPVAPSGTSTAEVAGLQTGVIKAALLASPLLEPLVASGKYVPVLELWKPNAVPGFDLPVATPVVTGRYATSHPGVISAFQRAIQEANDWAMKPANFNKMEQIIAARLKVDPSSIEAPLKTFQASLRPSTDYTQADWNLAVKVMKANGVLPSGQTYPYKANVIPVPASVTSK